MHPFHSSTTPETLTAIIRDEPPGEASGAPLPPAVRRIVSRCLEKNPEARYGSTRDLARDLRDLAVMPSGATAAAAPAIAAGLPRRGIWPFVLVGAAALLVGAALATWLRRPVTAEPIRVHPLTYSGADTEPAASPDGRLIAFTSWRDGVPRIWIKQIAGGGEAPVTAGPDGVARFSPDGSSLIFVHDVGKKQAVYRIGLVGGEPRPVLDDASAADWSPDGRRILFVQSSSSGTSHTRIGVLDLETGRERIVADEGNRFVHSPRWSPDGRRIAWASGSFSGPDWEVRAVDAAGGRVQDLCRQTPGFQIGGVTWSGSGRDLFFVQSPIVMGDDAGSGSRVIRCDTASDRRRTLFWGEGLVWTNSSVSEVTPMDVLAPGRLVFSERTRRANLREFALGASGAVGTPRLLAEGSAIDRQPAYSPDGSKILFSSNRGGNLDLWIIDRKSGAIRQFTDDPAQDWDPAWTADGKQVLWGSDRGSGHLEIWSANADGSGAHQVTHDGISAQNPGETPDGRWVVYWSGNTAKMGLWKIHPDGTGAVPLLADQNPALGDTSPDGRYALLVVQDPQNLRNTIRFVEIESGKLVPFTIEVPYTVGAPAIIWGRARWSPDGKSIYYVGENAKGLSGIYVQDFAPGRDTSASRREVAGFSRDYVTESFDISRDGAFLTLSASQQSSSIMVAEGVPGALPPARKTR